ncbi:MAG TPA: hypothetical protein VJS45_14995, partial [Acidimicrobiia bacterium]|nr:hypothetical protein [Acidimicrobiia bacterium]
LGGRVNERLVAAELAASLETISDPDLRVYPFPPDQLAAPAAIVGFPELIEFDVSAGRGVDRMTIPIYVVIDRTWDRSSADQFANLTAGSGPNSVKQVVQTKPHSAFSTARVRSVDRSVISVAGVEFWAATFLVDITGSGS